MQHDEEEKKPASKEGRVKVLYERKTSTRPKSDRDHVESVDKYLKNKHVSLKQFKDLKSVKIHQSGSLIEEEVVDSSDESIKSADENRLSSSN